MTKTNALRKDSPVAAFQSPRGAGLGGGDTARPQCREVSRWEGLGGARGGRPWEILRPGVALTPVLPSSEWTHWGKTVRNTGTDLQTARPRVPSLGEGEPRAQEPHHDLRLSERRGCAAARTHRPAG